MNKIKIGMFLLMQSIFLIANQICDPDTSIENQKTQKISQEGHALLVKIMNDKVSFFWPVEVCKCWVSSLFGPRKSGYHNGVDLAAFKGTAVYAAADGIVETTQKNLDKSGYGNMILMVHKDFKFYDDFGSLKLYKTRYAHLDTFSVKEGQVVSKGQKIGTVGATGRVLAKNHKSDPSHLHFEVYRGNSRINPLIVLFSSDQNWVAKNLDVLK
jgi:murein DD-endopeptidase MepM/ murein hydrolase activator NlpD